MRSLATRLEALEHRMDQVDEYRLWGAWEADNARMIEDVKSLLADPEVYWATRPRPSEPRKPDPKRDRAIAGIVDRLRETRERLHMFEVTQAIGTRDMPLPLWDVRLRNASLNGAPLLSCDDPIFL